MRKEEFNYPSADRETEIHAIRWIPDGSPRAVLQIAHGMVEHIGRYGEFAEYLADRGILVTGNDHLGHGKSVASPEALAHFPKKGNQVLLKDIHRLRRMTEGEYTGVPYFLMGHSMGSFLARQYLCMQGDGLQGAVIMGTGDMPAGLLRTAKTIAGIKSGIQGQNHHSAMLTKMAFGSYNKRIGNPVSKNAWLSRDDEQVRLYDEDPLCGMVFTNQAFAEMFASMLYLKKDANLDRMPKTLPVLFVSGEEDPVGGYGRQVADVVKKYRETGMESVDMKLYPGDRHEILNELDKETVYEELAGWIESRI